MTGVRTKRLAAAAILLAAPALGGCLTTDVTPSPPTAEEISQRRAALEEVQTELQAERKRSEAAAVKIEENARLEAKLEEEMAFLNQELAALEKEKAALSQLDQERRATAAQRARVQALEKEIRALKGLITDYSPN